ncbi:UV radiation resistance protein/autophagy-related protein 14 [Metarhizium rileyi]|uniref:Autophagy-related protein 14 n=1 Tax=Metarhizium rileyi (strain RCEF 4871) TaxID=1649241 RepID=A0A167GQ72_METRR|nr:UV radiation resistance protein/autophagy-related protein 14 [Metarhizium rileyi RCEF 4871]
MECHICHRDHDTKRLPFLCAVDARNSLYELRIKNLQALLENESLQGQVNELYANSSKSSHGTVQRSTAMQRVAEERTDSILASANKLKEQIQAAREEIRTRKTALDRRRSDLATVSNGLVERRVKQKQELDKSTQVGRFRWAQTAEATANTRAFLCVEAMNLYGLKRIKRGGPGRYEYHLGRVPIIDLTAMDSYTPDVISTSLAHVAHILILVCHYLSIRLPAEITLPHRDYPRPTIFNLNSSYQHSHVSFPSFSGASSAQTHSREKDSQRVPRPRPLFVDKTLTQLAKEDSSNHSFFLEGVTLLAYNIAWLCCCQGVSIGDPDNFEDICNMGRNLHSFFMSAQAHDFHPVNVKVPGWGPNGEEVEGESQGNWLGRYTHGGTFYFLGGSEGTELVRNFKLPSPMKWADKLKKKLIGDLPAPDWEVLDDDAWKIEDLPGTNTGATNGRNVLDKPADARSTPRSGTNGWTKVKHR